MKISKIDHIVLTVHNIEKTCEFYQRAFGLEVITFANSRQALQIGEQKINLHEFGKEFTPKALQPTPGAIDICLITPTPLSQVQQHLISCNVEIIAGPVIRTGAMGEIISLYLRDPDGNLIEVANYLK
ncbi:VOC family protein [Calothrix sp. 336/3]|uniref:VOC family protein n=1 Tax=Calothrix sp. 336/3 TaxID=1337936 RepID=UPI0004E3E22C|nr:VOC family protein [Calothrix sp. 336/3]AKG23185.1 hypothetical protein IJ00_19605 [Calothrix sp. 336/3]